MILQVAILLLVTNILGTSVPTPPDTSTTTTTERITMSKEEVMSNKAIEIKKFGENPLDDRVIHFTMSPDHDCKDGICSDGDFMLTDLPEFSKIHIHSVGDEHGGIIAEEFKDGTTIDTYIGATTDSSIYTVFSDVVDESTSPTSHEFPISSSLSVTTVEEAVTTMSAISSTSSTADTTAAPMYTVQTMLYIMADKEEHSGISLPPANPTTTISPLDEESVPTTSSGPSDFHMITTEVEWLSQEQTSTVTDNQDPDTSTNIFRVEEIDVTTFPMSDLSPPAEEMLSRSTIVSDTTSPNWSVADDKTNSGTPDTTFSSSSIVDNTPSLSTPVSSNNFQEDTTSSGILETTETLTVTATELPDSRLHQLDTVVELSPNTVVTTNIITSSPILDATSTGMEVYEAVSTIVDNDESSTTTDNVEFFTTTKSTNLNLAVTGADEFPATTSEVNDPPTTILVVDELLHTSMDAYELLPTTEAEELLSTTTEAVELLPTTKEAEELLPTTMETVELLPTTTKADVLLATTAESDELLPTTTEADELTMEADKLLPTTTEADELLPTSTESDELLPTTTEAYELLPTTVTDKLLATTTEADELLPTTTESDELLPITTEVDELVPTTESDKLLATTTEADELLPTTTESDELLPTTTESDELLPTTTVADKLLSTTKDELLPITTEVDEMLPTTSEINELLAITKEDGELLPPNNTEMVEFLVTTTAADELLVTTTKSGDLPITSTEADELLSTTTVDHETTINVAIGLNVTTSAHELGAAYTLADEILLTTPEAVESRAAFTQADLPLPTTILEDIQLFTGTTEYDQLMIATTMAGGEPLLTSTGAQEIDDELLTITTRVDEDLANITGTLAATTNEADDDIIGSFTILGEFEVINTFFQTPVVASNSSVSFFSRLLERDLGIMFEQASPSTPRKNVKIESVVVVENSSAYTRLKREIRGQAKAVGDATVLRVSFLVRYENVLLSAFQTSLLDTARQILLSLPGILTHTITLKILPDCSPSGSLHGDMVKTPNGCCMGTMCSFHFNRMSDTPFPPALLPSTPAKCSKNEEDCCPVITVVSVPWFVRTITNVTVKVVQGSSDKQRQMITQQMCASSTCLNGSKTCNQAFAVSEVLVTNYTGIEFIDYVLVGAGCDCTGEEVFETSTATEVAETMENRDINEFEDIENERFDEVLVEVRESFSKLLGMFFLSLSREIVNYYNGVTAGLVQKFGSFKNTSNAVLEDFDEFVQVSEGFLGRSLVEQDFVNFENKTLSKLEREMLSLKRVFNYTIFSTTEQFENVILDLIPLFERLENYCKLVVYSSKTPTLAKKVVEEFQHEYFVFEAMIRNQVDLAIESAKDLMLYYSRQHSSIASNLLSNIMSSNFSNVDPRFLIEWRTNYYTQSVLALEEFKNDKFVVVTDNLRKVLSRSLATVFADVHLLTECVQNSTRSFYEKDYYSKKEVDIAVQEALERVFGPFSAEIYLTVEKLSNNTEKFLESARNLLGLKNFDTSNNFTAKEFLASEIILESVQDIAAIRGLATALTNRKWARYTTVGEADDLFILNINQTLNVTESEARRGLSSKIDEEKSKLKRYFASKIDNISEITQINAVIENVFSNLLNTSLESLSTVFVTQKELLFSQLQETRLETELLTFNVSSIDVDLLANDLGPVLKHADSVIDNAIKKVVDDSEEIIKEFVISSDYINLIANQAIAESVSANETDLDLAKKVMNTMKMWQESQFDHLDSSLKSNRVRKEVILTEFMQGMKDAMKNANHAGPDVLALLSKRLKLKLWDQKSKEMKSLFQDTAALLGMFFSQTKKSLHTTMSNFTSTPELLQYIDMMVEIIHTDSLLGIEMNARETFALLTIFNATESTVSILNVLAQMDESGGKDLQSFISTIEDKIESDDTPDARASDAAGDRGPIVSASSSRISKCKTSGGRDVGKVCEFPFKWRGVTFYGCTREGRDGEWCPTQVHSGNLTTVDGKWGYCGQGCGDLQVQAQVYTPDLTKLIESLTAEVKRLRDMVKKVYKDESNVKTIKLGDKENESKIKNQNSPEEDKLNLHSDKVSKDERGSKANSVEDSKIPIVDNQIAVSNTSSQILPSDTSSLAVEGCSNIGSCRGRCGSSSSICSCEHNCGGTVECCCDRDIVCRLSPGGMVEDNIVPSPANKSSSEILSQIGKRCVDKGSCAGRCGGGSASDCWCDEMCDSSGDCCCDREYQCQLFQTGWEDKEKSSIEFFNKGSLSTPSSTVKTVEKPLTHPSVSSTIALTCRNSGSCSGRCGGGAEDDCWCNEICAESNSCCCDRDQFCDVTPLGMISKNLTGIVSPIAVPSKPSSGSTDERCKAGTCSGMCGGMAESGCWCDQLCEDSDDCCCDRDIVCYHSKEGWVDRGSTTKSSEGDESQSLGSSTVNFSSSSQSTNSGLTTPKLATLSSVIGSRVTVAPPSLLRGNKTVLSSGVPKRCKTIAGPNVNHGCVFPFTYRNKTFNSCPGSTIRGDPWCSTKVDSRQRFIAGFWGFCGRACPSATKQFSSIQVQSGQASNLRKPVLTSRDFVPLGSETMSQQVKGVGQSDSKKVIKKTEEGNSTIISSAKEVSVSGLDEIAEMLNPRVGIFLGDRGETNVTLDANATALEELPLASAQSSSPSLANETVEANVTTSEDLPSVASQSSLPSLANVTIEGNVITSEDLPSVAAQSTLPSLANITVEGNVTTSEDLPSVTAQSSLASLVNVTVDGNVTTSEDLPTVSLASEPSPPSLENVTVDVNVFKSEDFSPVSVQSSPPSLENVTVDANVTSSEDLPSVADESSSPSLVFVSTGNERVPYVKLRPKKTQCLTWAGPEKGQRCVFPFTYRNQTFSGCTQFWRQKSWWCATEVDSKGNLEGAKWGLCQDDCPRQGNDDENTVNIDIGGSKSSQEFDTLGKPIVENSLLIGNKPIIEDSVPQPAVQDECKVVSGADAGKSCQFPFTYHGKTYHGCTYNFGVDKPWCSTETDDSGDYIPGRWGYCSESCPAHTNHINECITVAGPRPLKLCVFPFMSEGVLHWGCTEKAGKFWCPTLVDDHVEVLGDNWGWCKERCKENIMVDPCINVTSTELVEVVVKIPSSNETSGALVSEEQPKFIKTSTTGTLDPGQFTSSSFSLRNRTATAPLKDTVGQSVNITSDLEVLTRENVTRTPDQLASSPKPVCINGSSCSGRCGGGSDDDCWCDDLCVQSGDCCCDIEKICSIVQETGPRPHKPENDNNRNSSAKQSDAFETPAVIPLITSTSESTTSNSDTSALHAVKPIHSANTSDIGPNVLDSLQTDDATKSGNVSTVEPFFAGSTMSSSTVASPISQSTEADTSISDMENSTSSAQKDTNTTSTSESLSPFPSSALPTDMETSTSLVSISFSPNFASEPASTSPITTSSDNLTKSIYLDNVSSTDTSTSASFNMSSLSRSLNRGCLLSGSCENMCGGGSDYTCWCDSECAKNDDCCCDMENYCVAHPGSEVTLDPSLLDTYPTRPSKLCKAGTCSGRCGGGSDHDCWCDELCYLHHYADCCCDVDTVCSFEDVQPHVGHNTITCSNSGSCSGRCGGGSDKDCWCDDLCVQSGDCCCDKEEECTIDLVSSTEGYTVSTIKMYNASSSTEYVLREGTVQDRCKSGCVTDNSGPRHNSCCLFPFVYNGEKHSTCIEVGGDKAWCSTKVDEDGLFISNEWGYCDKDCVFNTPSPFSISQGFNTSTRVAGSIETITTSTSTESRKPSLVNKTVIVEETKTSTASTTTPSTVNVKSSEAVASSPKPEFTATSTTTISSTKKTTSGSVWAPYVFVFKAKPSPDFLSKLPPAQSVVHIPPTQYDPVRALLGDLI